MKYPTDFDITQIIDTQYYQTKRTKITITVKECKIIKEIKNA